MIIVSFIKEVMTGGIRGLNWDSIILTWRTTLKPWKITLGLSIFWVSIRDLSNTKRHARARMHTHTHSLDCPVRFCAYYQVCW